MDPRLDNNLPIRNTPVLAPGLSNKMFFLLVKSIFSIYGKGESFLQLNSKCLVKTKRFPNMHTDWVALYGGDLRACIVRLYNYSGH